MKSLTKKKTFKILLSLFICILLHLNAWSQNNASTKWYEQEWFWWVMIGVIILGFILFAFSPPVVQRPMIISTVCILGFIALIIGLKQVISVINLSSSGNYKVAEWYFPYNGIVAVISGICLIGLWKMRKWAVTVYISLFILNQIFLLILDIWTPAYLINIIGIIFMLAYFRKMN